MRGKGKDFLEFDFKSMSDDSLLEVIDNLKDSETHIETMREARDEVIQRARTRQGLSTVEIVKFITRGRTRADRNLFAKEWSRALAITEREFRRIANQR